MTLLVSLPTLNHKPRTTFSTSLFFEIIIKTIEPIQCFTNTLQVFLRFTLSLADFCQLGIKSPLKLGVVTLPLSPELFAFAISFLPRRRRRGSRCLGVVATGTVLGVSPNTIL